MEPDDDLSALLPKAPLPRPDRRERAIDKALRRFSGAEPDSPVPHRQGAWWGRPQWGAALAMGLVALVALPVWIAREQGPAQEARPIAQDHGAVAADGVLAGEPGAPRLPVIPGSAVSEVSSPSKAAPVARVTDERADPVADDGAEAAAPAAKAEAAAPAMRLAPPPPPPAPTAPPPPPALVLAAPIQARSARRADEARERAELDDVVVTARRVESNAAGFSKQTEAALRLRQPRKTSRRGDWNACTVNDPARNAALCGAGQGADGLTQAWRNDLDGAIASFSAAIADSPGAGQAYLNRGLAYARKGDRARAMDDLDRAVRLMPDSARAHYSRGLLLGSQGARDRAAADAARAVELDPRYGEVVR